MGVLVSYSEGAWNRIPHVPRIQARVNVHRKKRSSTIATYFQSSMTCKFQTNTYQHFQTKFSYAYIYVHSCRSQRIPVYDALSSSHFLSSISLKKVYLQTVYVYTVFTSLSLSSSLICCAINCTLCSAANTSGLYWRLMPRSIKYV